MTIEEIIERNFNSELGQQCNSLFSTSDNRIFIRLREARKHADGKLDENTQPLQDKTILEWYEEFSGIDPKPTYRPYKTARTWNGIELP